MRSRWLTKYHHFARSIWKWTDFYYGRFFTIFTNFTIFTVITVWTIQSFYQAQYYETTLLYQTSPRLLKFTINSTRVTQLYLVNVYSICLVQFRLISEKSCFIADKLHIGPNKLRISSALIQFQPNWSARLQVWQSDSVITIFLY